MTSYEEDRYQPLPGLLGLPAFLWRKLSRGARVAIVVGIAAAVAVTLAVVVPNINHAKRTHAAAEARAHAAAVAAERRRLTEDQRPHHAAIASRSSAVAELQGAITADARARARRGALPGPAVRRTRCQPAALDRAGRAALAAGGRLFDCLALTPGSGAFGFVAVVDYRDRRLTWCKTNAIALTDAPALATVPLRPSCTRVSR